MPKCQLCDEKQREINRILAAYKKDKIFYRKVVLGLLIALVLTAFLGSDGLTIIIDIAKERFL